MRTEGDLIKINDWLLPLSWLYGLGVGIRNYLFDIGVLKQRAFDIPVISVGNITVGGSGKTPHVEYLVRLLKDIVRVAVLSRGYKRKTSGYVLAQPDTQTSDIGDEPCQMKRKYPDIYVAVDRKRCEGIDRLTADAETSDVDVILLDDAFQHRYVRPGINILLVDYHRLIIYDKLLPAGRLREPMKGKNRADMVIVTKCPRDLRPMEIRVLTKTLNLYPYQELFFTTIDYDQPRPLFAEGQQPSGKAGDVWRQINGRNVMLLTGIASPKQMLLDITPHCISVTPLAFGDHHNFKQKDVQRINETFQSMPEPKVIVTTEKDATRLTGIDGLSAEVRQRLLVMPIKVSFMLDQQEIFDSKIISYVRKNSKNSTLVKKKESHKPKAETKTENKSRIISFRDN